MKHQHPFQRGFTAATSHMNGALLVEEYLRECKDQKKTAYVAFLDVKSAFDVVSHSSLLRKLYNIGIDGQCWNFIYQLHQGGKSSVKWSGVVSESFAVEQGVRQGGLLSTDLFKVQNNPLLCKVSDSGYGAMIGNIRCGAPTVADDTTFMSDSKQSCRLCWTWLSTTVKDKCSFFSLPKVSLWKPSPQKLRLHPMLKIMSGPLMGKKCLL